MRPNTATRSFALVVLAATAPYAVLLLAGCALTAYLADRVSDDGFDVLTSGLLIPTTAVLALLAAGAVAGGVSAARQLRATRRLERHVALATLPSPPHLPPGVTVVDADEPFAFTLGLTTVRIAVSRGLVERLSPQELDSVIAHERYHLQARDPLKLLIARAATRTCFFLPAVRHLMARYMAGRELAADRQALHEGGAPALAGALLKVVAGPDWSGVDTAAAMADHDLLAVRVAQLEQGSEPPFTPLPAASVAVSAAVLGLVTAAIVLTSGRHGLSMVGAPGADGTVVASVWAAVGGVACSSGWFWLALLAWRRVAPGS